MPNPGAGTKDDPTTLTRLSFTSAASHPKDIDGDYRGSKTPEIEGGALREGGAPVLLSRDCIGLLFQYAAVGLVYGMLPQTVYPFIQQYLNSSGARVATASTLVVMPWSFKVFYGIMSDCFPLFGYRRRPYMLVGWAICLVMLITMAVIPVGKPYFTHPEDREVDPADYTDEIKARLNYNAPGEGSKYIFLMFLAAFGYVMADVSADSITVEFAQREPEAVRGKTQSMIYIVRTAVQIFGQIIVGFCFNGKDYGGDFDFSLSFNHVMIICAVGLLPVFPSTWYWIKEEKHPRANFKQYMSDLFDLISKRAVFQVLWYVFLSRVFSDISYTASSPVQSYLAGVTPINDTISSILSNLLFMFGLMVTSRYGLHWNWRIMIVATGVFVIIIDCATTLITVWDIFRSQWFWLGPPIAVQLPAGVGWMIGNFVIVELAGEGNEGATYGLITTVANCAAPFANSLQLVMDAPFNLTTERIQNDDHSIRMDITYVVIIMYCCTAFAWAFLPMLPKQKEATQELMRAGGTNKKIGAFTIAVFMFALVWSIMTNIMGIFDSTSCLIIAGGSGC